jgi:hypothetical protein
MNRQKLLDLYFMDARAKLIDIAAFLDRIDRAEGEADFRYAAFRRALDELNRGEPVRAKSVLLSLSDPTTNRSTKLRGKAPVEHGLALIPKRELNFIVRYIEPHAHMVSRTTDDYEAMVTAGCAAVCEPAFWAGFDRSGAQGFYDYFCQLTDYEPKRAAKYGLAHYCWLCINPKRARTRYSRMKSWRLFLNSWTARLCLGLARLA